MTREVGRGWRAFFYLEVSRYTIYCIFIIPNDLLILAVVVTQSEVNGMSVAKSLTNNAEQHSYLSLVNYSSPREQVLRQLHSQQIDCYVSNQTTREFDKVSIYI